jgi:protoporphyrinogen/coproporphyrinogen III oxidase
VSGARVIIVGGGISGLAAAEHIRRNAPDFQVTMIEASSRLGGCVQTERCDGYVLELGPDVLLASKPAAVKLCERLGIADRLHGTSTSSKGSYVLSRGSLQRLPNGLSGLVPSRLGSFLATPLISPLGKLRVAAEYFLPRRRGSDDESVRSFIVRRFGVEMYERLAEPLLSGIFAGDAARISIGAAFPQLRSWEQEHGGVLRAMLKLRRAKARAVPQQPGKTHAGFLSLPNGLGEIVDATEAFLKEPVGADAAGCPVEIRRGTRAVRLDVAKGKVKSIAETAEDGDVHVTLDDGSILAGDAVILALPSYASAALIERVAPKVATTLREIEYVSTATVSLAYAEADVRQPLDATGYTVPRAEGRPVIACTWSSAKFANRAPPGQALFRIFLGGAGREYVLAGNDDELVAVARAEMRGVMGITAKPKLVRVHRWLNATPQYSLGHLDRLAAIERNMAAIPCVSLAGNAYHGVGIPDCVRSGELAAARAIAAVTSSGDTPEAPLGFVAGHQAHSTAGAQGN